MLPNMSRDGEDRIDLDTPVAGEQLARRRAIRQIERRRRFRFWAMMGTGHPVPAADEKKVR
jgi:hypothetical protein